VPIYAQLPYFGFECLSGNAQLNRGAGWTRNHTFGFPESGFDDLSFVLGKVSNQRSSRRSQFGSHVREPGLIYKESLPLRDPYWPLRAARELGQAISWLLQYLRAAPEGSQARVPVDLKNLESCFEEQHAIPER
jgi:hypothetical protein